jgi:hypothetical protein
MRYRDSIVNEPAVVRSAMAGSLAAVYRAGSPRTVELKHPQGTFFGKCQDRDKNSQQGDLMKTNNQQLVLPHSSEPGQNSISAQRQRLAELIGGLLARVWLENHLRTRLPSPGNEHERRKPGMSL